MLKHAQYVLGVHVVFTMGRASCVWDRMPSLPATSARRHVSKPRTRECPAMLFPRGSELFAVYLDERHGMFAQAQDSQGELYMMSARWGGLKHVFPADSSVLVIVYENKNAELVMGVYDVLRVGGQDKSALGTFDRQQILFDMFTAAQLAGHLGGLSQHWVGMEEYLVQFLQAPGSAPPFEVDHMLRLRPADARAEAARDGAASEAASAWQYELVLRPLVVSALLRTTGC